MNILTMKLIGEKVLIQAYEWPDKTKGGIWFPDMLKYSNSKGGKDPWRGRIISIGSKVKQVKPGEIVRYQPGNYFRETIENDGIRYIVLEEILIYAVEDENENLIRALENRVVFLPEKSLKEKYGHLYLPQIHEEKHLYGKIVVAGPKSGVNSGDQIIIENKSTWQYFDSAGERYILTDRFNLLAKVITYCECDHPTMHRAGTMQDGSELITCAECEGVIKTNGKEEPTS